MQSDEEQERGYEEEAEAEDKPPNQQKQSPWDFAANSESVAEEHTRRSTTSIDYKISKLLQQRPAPVTADEDDSDSETDRQAACIPLALTGCDICGSAITGSGKTAAYALPIPAIHVLILTPTRELAVQVHSMIEKLAQYTDIRCCLVVGGLSTKVQVTALRSMPDIVVATPGRMIDHLRNSMSVDLDDLAVLILDEADRLLELGFSVKIHELVFRD
ncbi:hypothetical protein Dsin_009874 [Dipteronia sinensis]|uniref:Helicase ATP-binding domain-containing protein n=1 Tax=Dipteronia sinensis TaxID=43782 RepID=A0AAE0ECC4_9ROSI|nr:hypothetical protein Dsin_009874 [Dipteronia sinensis]